MAACAAMSLADRKAVAYAALAKIAGKRTNRDLLFAGADYPVELTVAAKVGRGSFKETISGTLSVGEDQQSSTSSACDQAELLACVAGELPKPKREKLFARLLDGFKADGNLPAVDKELVAACKVLIDQLRASKVIPKRGNVTFAETVNAAS